MFETFLYPEGKMNIEVQGEAEETIVLLHGTASYHFCWRNVTKTLSKTYKVFVPELLGYGMSDKPRNILYSKEAHAERLILWLKTLGKNVHLVGHSIGGEIAVHIATKAPELIKTLTLVSPDGLRKGVNPFVRFLAKKGYLEKLFQKGMSKPPKLNLTSRMMDMPIESLTEDFLSEWRKPFSHPNIPYMIAKTIEDDDTGKANPKDLKMPILLIYGTKDGLVPKKVFESYEKVLVNPKIEVYEDCRHILMEQCPDYLSDSIVKFVENPESELGQKIHVKPKRLFGEGSLDPKGWFYMGMMQGGLILLCVIIWLLVHFFRH